MIVITKVRVEELQKGERFTCASGDHYVYERVDGASSGVHHVVGKDGRKTSFAGCADVVRGWNDKGWFQIEREARRNA